MKKALKILAAIDGFLILSIPFILVTRDKSTGYSGWIIVWPLLFAVIVTILLLLLGIIYLIKYLLNRT